MLPETHKISTKILDVRPFQLMCMICHLGNETRIKPETRNSQKLFEKLYQNPLQLVRVCCNVDAYYQYQNPGIVGDTPEGEWFNVKRDLDIIQKLGLVPGDVRPANELFNRVLMKIKESGKICGMKDTSAKKWQGCAFAACGDYEKGIAENVIEKIFSPRSAHEIEAERKYGIEEIERAEILNLIPMHFMCLACFHNDGHSVGHIDADLLFEVWGKIRKNPDIAIKIVRKNCMVCKSCKTFDPNLKMCVYGGKIGAELRQLQKELNILQILGLEFDDILPAKKLFKLIKEKIPSNYKICAYDTGVVTAPEWNICCHDAKPGGSINYIQGLAKGCIYNN